MIDTPKTARKPDAAITTKIDGQIIIVRVFFDHDSKETFADRLLKIILADKDSMNNESRETGLPTKTASLFSSPTVKPCALSQNPPKKRKT